MAEETDYIDEITMQSTERRPYTVNYAGRLPSGVTISSCAVSAVNLYTGQTDNSILSSTSASTTTTTASVGLRSVANNTRYAVSFLATTTDANFIPKDDILVIGDNI